MAQTSTRLVMRHRPLGKWWQGGLIFAFSLVFVISGLFVTPVSASFNCHRFSSNQINCELKQFRILGGTKKQRIFDPQIANIRTKSGSRGGSRYQVVISSPQGEFEIQSPTHNYEQNQQVASQINSFISSQQTDFSVRQNQWHDYSLYFLFILVLMTIGMFLITSPVENCTFYKSLNKVVIERKGLRDRKLVEYPFSEILRVDIESKSERYGKRYRLILILKFLQEIPIHQNYTNKEDVSHCLFNIHLFMEHKI
ncbi:MULTISPECIES: hypothetical protein [Nostocales]|nr:hypothetical protein [Tolypothrix bouteillei]